MIQAYSLSILSRKQHVLRNSRPKALYYDAHVALEFMVVFCGGGIVVRAPRSSISLRHIQAVSSKAQNVSIKLRNAVSWLRTLVLKPCCPLFIQVNPRLLISTTSLLMCRTNGRDSVNTTEIEMIGNGKMSWTENEERRCGANAMSSFRRD